MGDVPFKLHDIAIAPPTGARHVGMSVRLTVTLRYSGNGEANATHTCFTLSRFRKVPAPEDIRRQRSAAAFRASRLAAAVSAGAFLAAGAAFLAAFFAGARTGAGAASTSLRN